MDFVQLDLGGVLVHTMVDVPHDGTRWAASPAPTVTLYHRGGGVLRDSATASTGPSLYVTSTAAADGRTIVCTTTTGLERWEQCYIRSTATGHWETVTVDKFTSTTVTILDPLRYSYSTGDYLESHRMTTTLSESDAGNVELNCWAQWAYTVDGVKRKESTVFHISRYAPRLSLTAAEAMQAEPRLRDMLGSDQRIELLLRRIWHKVILPDVSKMIGSPGGMVSGEAIEEAVLLKLQEYVLRKSNQFEAAAHYKELYSSQLDEMRLSVIDMDEDGGQARDETPRGARTPRVMRG